MKGKTIALTKHILILCLIVLGACHQEPLQPKQATFDISSVPDRSGNGLQKVTFLPYWVANAQFAGYYTALELGIYKRFGLDVEIIPYQPFITSSEWISTGKADFAAIWLLNAVEMKASGVDLVNIAQYSTRSSLMLVTKKNSGIDRIEKMNGHKAAIWSGYELQPKTLFAKYKLDVELVPIGSTNNLFLVDGVEIINANWFDEYHSILNSGYNTDELNTFFFADYGLNFLEDGIYCLSDLRKNNPELCANFVKATELGWYIAFQDPERAIDIVIQYARKALLPVNRPHQRWMLNRYKDLYYSGNQFSTILKESDYQFAGQVLKDSKLINEVPPFESFYRHYEDK